MAELEDIIAKLEIASQNSKTVGDLYTAKALDYAISIIRGEDVQDSFE